MLPRLSRARLQIWLLFGLLPVAALCVSLHIREVVRTGLWQTPVYAVPGEGPRAYPLVGGETAEVLGARHDLRPGDVLLRIGERDLAGHGHLGFLGRAYEEVDGAGRAPLEIERDGRRLRTTLEMAPFAFPWLRVPFLVLTLAIAALLAWRRREDPGARQMALALTALVIGEAIFEGGGLHQTVVARSLFIFGGLVWWPLITAMLATVPARGDEAAVPGLGIGMLVAAGLWTLPKLQYLLGGPLPAPWIPTSVAIADAVTLPLVLGFFVANYRRADEAKRRSLRWVLYATFLAAILMVAALALPALAPGSPVFGRALGVAGFAGALIPVGLFVSMTAYDLFDVDRLMSATASYSLVLAGGLALLLAGVPALASLLEPLHAFDPETGRLVLSVAMAAVAVLGAQRLQPRLETLFFPERRRVEGGFERLLREQEAETTPEGVAGRVAKELFEIFDARFACVLARRGDRFELRGRGLGRVPALEPIPALDPILIPLAGGARLLSLDPRQRAGLRAPPEHVPPSLHAAEAALLLPIRRAGETAALVVVGRKRSDDVYTGADRALLGAALEAARRHLERVRQAEILLHERGRAEAADRQRREVEAAHLARSRHLAAASHDLRQPLHALRLSAEALRERVHDDESRMVVEHIHRSAMSLHEMFDALIDLARLDHGTLPITRRVFAIDPLLERLRAEAEPLARAKGLALDARGCGGSVESDPVLLGRILQNLLVNAIRYTPSGSVTLAAARDGPRVRVEVVDTGPGIPADQRERVFGEFVRLGTAGSQNGLGLGLAIVSRLAEQLGHAVTLKSEEGCGSRFAVVLPRAEPLPETPAPPTASLADLTGRRALVADDDLTVLASMRSLLQSWGVHVTLAGGLDEALDAWRDAGGALDVLLVDYRLADGEVGTAVVDALRQQAGRPLPAVVITGSSDREVLDDIEARGLVALPKPVSPARLRATLAAVLREAEPTRPARRTSDPGQAGSSS